MTARTPILVFLGICYFLNYPILMTLYPNVSEDYYQYIEFVRVRFQLYDMMFACAFWYMFMESEKRLARAVSCFMMIMASASFVDKSILHIYEYLITDIALIVAALIISIKVYGRINNVK